MKLKKEYKVINMKLKTAATKTKEKKETKIERKKKYVSLISVTIVTWDQSEPMTDPKKVRRK